MGNPEGFPFLSSEWSNCNYIDIGIVGILGCTVLSLNACGFSDYFLDGKSPVRVV